MNLVIIAPVTGARDLPRLSKLIEVLDSNQCDFQFYGWNRNGNKTSEIEETSYHIKYLMRGGGVSNLMLMFYYPLWILVVFMTVLRGDATRYYCIGFFSAFPVAVASYFRDIYYLFDNNDNITMSYRWPKFLKPIIRCLEKLTVKRSQIHLVPGYSRWQAQDKNLRVVTNTPTFKRVARAQEIAKACQGNYGDSLVIYINGWLTPTRGMSTILKAVKILDKASVNVIVAGELQCDEAIELASLDNVKYYGRIDNETALSLYYHAHVTITLYDPSIEINVIAEPNKWGDCIVTNTPFIANEEIATLAPYAERKACFTIKYDAHESLADMLKSINSNRDLLADVKNNLKEFKAAPWDVAIKEVLADFLQKNCCEMT